MKKVAIVGGGAAGFFCAINLARLNPSLKVCLLEKTDKLLSKVKISGGGRCNVTHYEFVTRELLKNYPRGKNELPSLFSRFAVGDTISWFAERGVDLHAEDDGRMFPNSNSSQTIIDCFLAEAKKYKVEIILHTDVKNISQNENGHFKLLLSNEKEIEANKVVITCGGFPKEKSYDWLTALGHTVVKPVPSLFTFNLKEKEITPLMGLSVPDASIKILNPKMEYRGPMLITHWGFSGPAILKLSAFAARELFAQNYEYKVRVKWLAEMDDNDLKESIDEWRQSNPKQQIASHNPFGFPKRLWEYFIQKASIKPEKILAELAKKDINKLIEVLMNDQYDCAGKTTYKEEFVTSGGIELSEIEFKTMESRLVKGLYFAGEVLNIDGITGGFNFQAAWSSAYVAAESISKEN